MRTVDFTPVFRSTVGFDRMARLLDHAMRATEAANAPTFPPYNIEKLGEDDYRITMAVAGFGEGDLDITAENGQLVISGRIEKSDEEQRNYLHRGIATRNFERRFDLADHIRVKGASLENGLLHVSLVREVPEAMKPRKIAITGATATKAIEDKHAA
ncbi:heat-shock protein Hsp20 [Thalassobaculum fulvum]|uniref:Heat-shock protein Hsp20 n=1 Tax=Thalassobaculum fulvum TaxID=1633335 RepID=A0A919CPV4_9PROT|nr:Hsp20 family protein [Thalassobaculum fulvum]GHD52320.1 heat-shock protein Hsp20 [Thalassobaculum fulvum]